MSHFVLSKGAKPRGQRTQFVGRLEGLEGRSLAGSMAGGLAGQLGSVLLPSTGRPAALTARRATRGSLDAGLNSMTVVALGGGEVRASASQLIRNGGFENIGVKLRSKAATVAAGSSALNGWTVVSGTVNVQAYWQTSQGRLNLDLNGTSAGTIRQSFSTVVGATYQLSFTYGNNPDQAGLVATGTVSVAGATSRLSQNLSHSGSTAENMNATTFTATFTADSTTTSLTFASTTSGSYGLVLDRVEIRAVS